MSDFDAKIASTCAARAICSAHNAACAPTCLWYRELSKQIAMSEIPARFLNVGAAPASLLAMFALLEKSDPAAMTTLAMDGWGAAALDNVRAGKSLFLTSRKTGNGKSSTAFAIALDVIRAGVSEALRGDAPVGEQLVQYAHVPSLMRLCKQIYEDDRDVAAAASEKVARITRRLLTVPLVILDDIGAEKPSEAIVERLLSIIDSRWSDGKATIYTSNKTLEEIEITLGKRIKSRVSDALAVAFAGRDQRGGGRR